METESRRAVERRVADRRKQSLVLVHQLLLELHLSRTAASLLEEYRDQSLTEWEAVENVSIPVLIGEYEAAFEAKFDRKPSIIRARPSPAAAKKKTPGKDENSGNTVKTKTPEEPKAAALEVVGTKSSEKPSEPGNLSKNIARKEISVPPHLTSELRELAQLVISDCVRSEISGDVEIFGLEDAKQALKEAVTWPLEHPEIFGDRKFLADSWRGVLLFGAPGNGKTLLARSVACESEISFFPVSPSLLLSKWRGESEKLVRVLFEVAQFNGPSVIFIDEVDSIFPSRTEFSNEHEATRRMRAELLAAMDGVADRKFSNVFVVAGTNFPWLLSDALLRRFEKRILVPEPDEAVRGNLFRKFLPEISDSSQFVAATAGWSCDDIRVLCKQAAMAALRRCMGNKKFPVHVALADLHAALARTKPASDVRSSKAKYADWADKFASNFFCFVRLLCKRLSNYLLNKK